jgi:peptidoglycan hydrolase-like protein with peptidoglycan-binding domain
MATYNQISYGSSGSTVTELQKLLNQNGYNIAVDGIFGANTQAAVKDYQQKNGLAADGIVGTNTWGALTSSNKPSTPTAPSAPSTGGNKAPSTSRPSTSRPSTSSPAVSSPTFNYGDYKPSDTVAKAEDLLNQHLAQKPGEYQSAWQDQINEILQQILNREKFSYDLNGDALYQQYKDQYTAQGKMAMMDAIGMAQAATGGYGNSYAESVGQQTYQGYLQNLNDKVPELYQLALNKYQMEGDEMRNQAAIMAQQEEQDYGRYRDLVNDWQTQRDYLAGRYDTERDYDYSIWADGRDFAYNQFADDRNYNYQVSRDQVLDAQWQAEFNEAVRQFNQQYALQAAAASGGYSGGSYSGGGDSTYTSSSSTSGYNNSGYSTDLVKKAQAFVGTTVDGAWGANSTAAAKAKGYGSLAAVINDMGYTSVGALAGNQKTTSTPTATKADFKSVTQDLNNLIASGANKSECNALINSALASGIITSAQATSLRNTFVPKGLT